MVIKDLLTDVTFMGGSVYGVRSSDGMAITTSTIARMELLSDDGQTCLVYTRNSKYVVKWHKCMPLAKIRERIAKQG